MAAPRRSSSSSQSFQPPARPMPGPCTQPLLCFAWGGRSSLGGKHQAGRIPYEVGAARCAASDHFIFDSAGIISHSRSANVLLLLHRCSQTAVETRTADGTSQGCLGALSALVLALVTAPAVATPTSPRHLHRAAHNQYPLSEATYLFQHPQTFPSKTSDTDFG
jgi:hypothetical protein